MARLKYRCPSCNKITWHSFDVVPGAFRYHCHHCGKVHREADFRQADERRRGRSWEVDGEVHR